MKKFILGVLVGFVGGAIWVAYGLALAEDRGMVKIEFPENNQPEELKVNPRRRKYSEVSR